MRARELYRCYYNALLPLYGEYEARSCSRLLLEELYGITPPDYDQEIVPLIGVVERLAAGQPVQQIIGHAWFYDLKFEVNEYTLIPRNETEELVDWIIKENGSRKGLSVLDIGTGSGAIAISLSLHLQEAEVVALDFSAGALTVAQRNSESLGATICFAQKDILVESPEGKFDIIVSNPPYITKKEKPLMHRNVLDYEPHTALFVENNDPLLFYRRTAELALSHLKKGGALYYEINENYGQECCDLLRNLGFTNVILRKDLNSKDRMVKATISSK